MVEKRELQSVDQWDEKKERNLVVPTAKKSVGLLEKQ
jgi:hypothetical protein